MGTVSFNEEQRFDEFKRRLPEELTAQPGFLERILLRIGVVSSQKSAERVLFAIACALCAGAVVYLILFYPWRSDDARIFPPSGFDNFIEMPDGSFIDPTIQ